MLHMVTPVQQAHHVPLFRQAVPPPGNDLRRQIVGMVRTSDHHDGHKTTAIVYDLRERQLVSRISRKLADLNNKRESHDHSTAVDPERKLLEAKAELGGTDPNASRRKERLSSNMEGRLLRKLSPWRDGRALLPDRFRQQPGPSPSPPPYLRHDPRYRPRPPDQPAPVTDRPLGKTSQLGRSRNPYLTHSPPRGSPGVEEGGSKRPTTGYNVDKRSASRNKSVHFRPEDAPAQVQSSSSSDTKSGGKAGEETCEVRGSAISTASSRLGSPSKRADSATKRNLTYSASLDMFRRRLRLNQTKFLQTRDGSEEYVIKRADLTHRHRSPSPLRARHTPHPPVRLTPEPLQDENSKGRDLASRSSFRHTDVTQEVKPDTPVPLGQSRPMPKVKTYVLEAENQCQAMLQHRNRLEEPVALTQHNLDVHNMLQKLHKKSYVYSDPDLGFTCDFRLMQWLDEANTHNRLQRMVRFNVNVPSGQQASGDGTHASKANNHKNDLHHDDDDDDDHTSDSEIEM